MEYMKIAIKEAQKAYRNGDVPVGAVIVLNGKVLAKAYNKKEKSHDPTMHAEIIAIKKACKKLGNFRLVGAELYVTKEPCVMCYGACLSARIDKIYYGASDARFGISNLHEHIKFNHKVDIVGGVMEQQCSSMLSTFFEDIRGNKCK